MPDLLFRPLKIDDLDSIIKIENLCFAEEPWTLEAFKEEIVNPIAFYIVALLDGQPAAYGGMWIIVDEAHITNIAVHTKYQNMGIGSQLFDKMESTACNMGADAMTLEVRKSNLTAQNLYKRKKFTVSGVRKAYYANNKEDALIMWKRNLNDKVGGVVFD